MSSVATSIDHGTVNAYANLKCRCGECGKAMHAYRLERFRIRPELAEKHKKYATDWYYNNLEYAKQYRRDWSKNNPDKARANKLKKYGLTIEDYDQIFSEQGNKCAACGNGNPTSKRKFHVDHDHATGRVRGILCGNCNSALGLLKDNINNIMGLLSYMERQVV